MTTIYRDFNREYIDSSDCIHVPVNHFIGGIEVEIVSGQDHRICLMVTGLQENGNAYFPLDYPSGQADVMVTIEPTIDLYDAIMTVLDKVTADHQYNLPGNPCNRGNPYKDFILCSDALVQEHPELCYESKDQEERCYMGGHWMPFTRESMVYVDAIDFERHHEDTQYTYSYLPHFHVGPYENIPTNVRDIMIHGEVNVGDDGHPVFTYDYPIISRDMGQKYYELTRGKRVCDVTYTDLYPDDEEDENDQE